MIKIMDDSTVREILTGAIGNFLGGVLLALVGFVVLDQTKVRPWVYKYFKPVLVDIYQKIVDLLFNKYFRILIFALSIFLVNVGINKALFSIVATLVLLSFAIKQRYDKLTFPSSEFSEGFHKVEDIEKDWLIKTGKVALDESMGRPRPSLKMILADPPEATNTFVLLKKLQKEYGVIECDIFLYAGSVINIVFLCDKEKDNWHMARFDTRDGTSDGFLIKDQGKGVNWRFNNMSGTRTNPGSWYRVRVEFNSEKARMFREGELLAEITNPQIFGNYIGIFNECGEVRTDNFTFSSR